MALCIDSSETDSAANVVHAKRRKRSKFPFRLCAISAVGLNDEWAFFVPSLRLFPFQYFWSRPTQIGPGSNPNGVGFRSIRLLTG